jgi:glycerol-3-phosphate dehydrogenase (NAD(P)+)
MNGAARAVVGAGAWGATLAGLLARSGPVTLVCRDPSRVGPIEGVKVGADPSMLAAATDLVVMAVPSRFMRETARRVSPFVPAGTVLLSVAKGLEAGTLMRMTEVLAEEVQGARVAALSGPNLAPEIARGLPASSVVAAADDTLSAQVVDVLGSRTFRLYRNRDVIGVELAGALKNIVAIAAGAVDQLGYGDSGKAAIITRGLAEITRLGVAAGANPLTFAGLAGIGDIVATCSSPLSRNHRLGMELAAGRSWPEIEATLPGVAEGAWTVDSALALADRLDVELPIAREVHLALYEGKRVEDCLRDLLDRPWKEELAGLDVR